MFGTFAFYLIGQLDRKLRWRKGGGGIRKGPRAGTWTWDARSTTALHVDTHSAATAIFYFSEIGPKSWVNVAKPITILFAVANVAEITNCSFNAVFS